MKFHRAEFFAFWFVYLFSFAVVADQAETNIEPTFDEVTKALQKALRAGDIKDVIDWSDTRGVSLSLDQWIAYFEDLDDLSATQRDLLFVAMARSCLFSPRGVESLLNDAEKRNTLLGGLVLNDVTFTPTRPPTLGKRYLAGGGRIVALTLKRQDGPATPILFVGLGKEVYKIGDQVQLEDIEYVNTEFSDYELPEEEKPPDQKE